MRKITPEFLEHLYITVGTHDWNQSRANSTLAASLNCDESTLRRALEILVGNREIERYQVECSAKRKYGYRHVRGGAT